MILGSFRAPKSFLGGLEMGYDEQEEYQQSYHHLHSATDFWCVNDASFIPYVLITLASQYTSGCLYVDGARLGHLCETPRLHLQRIGTYFKGIIKSFYIKVLELKAGYNLGHSMKEIAAGFQRNCQSGIFFRPILLV
jgi:hypothetical protein